jgi:hypothetical protein
MTRSELESALKAAAGLSAWEVYGEPPEQLVGPSLIIAPRQPYLEWETYSQVMAHVVCHLVVTRAHGPAMDTLDAGLVALWKVLRDLGQDVAPSETAGVNVLEAIGGTDWLVASVDVDLENGADLT